MVFCEFGRQQIRQVLQVSMGAGAYASNKDVVEELVTFIFSDLMFTMPSTKSGRLFQLILEWDRKETEILLCI